MSFIHCIETVWLSFCAEAWEGCVIKACHGHDLWFTELCLAHRQSWDGEDVWSNSLLIHRTSLTAHGPWGIVSQGIAAFTVNPETHSAFPQLCDQCPNSTRNLLNTVPRSIHVQKGVLTLTQAGIWTTDFAVPIACHGREWAKGMFLHVVLRGSSGGCRHVDMCSIIAMFFPRLCPRTTDPGTKGVDVLGCPWMSLDVCR